MAAPENVCSAVVVVVVSCGGVLSGAVVVGEADVCFVVDAVEAVDAGTDAAIVGVVRSFMTPTCLWP
jgi:hypothetical protein